MDLPLAADAEAASGTGPTRQLAAFAAGLELAAIDEFARCAARRHVIDTVGAMIAGAGQDATVSAERAYQAAGMAAGAVPVPGVTRRYDALAASYVGGTAGHGLELDDGYRPGSVHPGGVVVPAALSLGFLRDASGGDVLRAVVAGYEAVCRIAAAAHPRSRWRGFHNTGITGVFGSAAAAGVLLGFDTDGMENTFGIAGSAAAGLFSFLAGGDVKRTHPGHAAREGLMAALLSESGLAGPRGVLEFKEGFFNAFAGGDTGAVDYRAIDLLRSGDNNRNSSFAIANCYMKPHACCRHIHSAIDAVIDIARAEELAPGDVELVEIGTYAVAASHASVGWSEMTTAQMSFPFVIALALARRQVGLDDFGEADRADPTILGLTRRIKVGTDTQCDADYPRLRAADVTLTTTGGRRFSRYVPEPYGAASNPLSDEALARKFTDLAVPRLGAARAEAALEMMSGIEALPSIRPLMETLCR